MLLSAARITLPNLVPVRGAAGKRGDDEPSAKVSVDRVFGTDIDNILKGDVSQNLS